MASGDKIFLDTDVALDHLAERQPFAEYAHRLLALAETGELTFSIHLTARSVSHWNRSESGRSLLPLSALVFG